jgi:hypothetical protein
MLSHIISSLVVLWQVDIHAHLTGRGVLIFPKVCTPSGATSEAVALFSEKTLLFALWRINED